MKPRIKPALLRHVVLVFIGCLCLVTLLAASNASLVSTRSYGTSIGTLMYVLPGFAAWYVAVYRRVSRETGQP